MHGFRGGREEEAVVDAEQFGDGRDVLDAGVGEAALDLRDEAHRAADLVRHLLQPHAAALAQVANTQAQA
ncbi:hypothetical protein FQZ97_977570 [compost metagenome]